VKEEELELHEAISDMHKNPTMEQKEKVEEELGDLLFSLVNYSRFLDVDPEQPWNVPIRKFISRFSQMEHRRLRKAGHYMT
jgi:uncharacterized protein YabN with tetrapyrrole methylase and pyrophosphatase domain